MPATDKQLNSSRLPLLLCLYIYPNFLLFVFSFLTYFPLHPHATILGNNESYDISVSSFT